jgi:hypothetical protein
MSKTQLEHAATGYDTDFYEWCLETAALLRDRRFDEIDLEHVAEEIEATAKRDWREVQSRLVVLIMNLLKWQIQSHHKYKSSWESTIREQRSQVELVLNDSPSLARITAQDLPTIYPRAVKKAVGETGLDAKLFPKTYPFTAEQILRDDFFPE